MKAGSGVTAGGDVKAGGGGSRAVARRLVTEASGGRGYLIAAGLCGLAVTGLILAQAQLIAHALAGRGGWRTRPLDCAAPCWCCSSSSLPGRRSCMPAR